jgi:FkbM family methyltransferase
MAFTRLDATVAAALGALPPGLGQQAVARRWYVNRLAHLPAGTLHRTRFRSGAVLDLDLADRMQGESAIARDYDPAVARFIAGNLPDGGVFFDVGANVGMISFSVAALARPRQITIHAFEPARRNAERFRHNATLNPVTAHLTEAAVADRAGMLNLVATDPRDKDSNYFIADHDDLGRDTQQVETITLDDYIAERDISRVDVMKIDVEGFEAKVLTGATQLLDRFLPRCVLCEAQDAAELGNILSDYGYLPRALPPVAAQRLRRTTRGETAFTRP